jgi:hypothetical protein
LRKTDFVRALKKRGITHFLKDSDDRPLKNGPHDGSKICTSPQPIVPLTAVHFVMITALKKFALNFREPDIHSQTRPENSIDSLIHRGIDLVMYLPPNKSTSERPDGAEADEDASRLGGHDRHREEVQAMNSMRIQEHDF